MTNDIYLGRCLFQNERYTRLEPLLHASPKGWVVILNRRDSFPEVGNVFSIEKPFVGASEGSVWLFKRAPNSQLKARAENDLYLAVEGAEPIEVLDLSGHGPEGARRALVEVGLPKEAIGSHEIVAVISPGHCVRGKLALDPIRSRWVLAEIDLELVDIYEFDPSFCAGAEAAGHRYVLPGREPSRKLFAIDWSPDADFLQRVLRRLKKAETFQPNGDIHELSNRAIERLVSGLRHAEALSADIRASDAMRRRLESFVPNLKRDIGAARSIAEMLSQAPPVARALDAEISGIRERMANELRTELEPKIEAELRTERISISAELEALKRECTLKRVESQKLEIDINILSEQKNGLTTELSSYVDGFIAKLEKVSDLAGHLGLSKGVDPEVRQSVPAPWSIIDQGAGSPLALTQLGEALSKAEEVIGLPPRTLLELDALVRAGSLPLVFGRDSEMALYAYSSVVAGGNVRRMPLDAATLGLDDIWHREQEGETAFARAWGAAIRDPTTPVLVVLDDVDVHHLGTWMPRLAGLLEVGRRPPNLLIVATSVRLPRGNIGRAELIDICVPFEIDGGVASAAAAIAASGVRKSDVSVTCVVPTELPAIPEELIKRLTADLLAIPGINPRAARRALACLQVSLGTMPESDAWSFASACAKVGLAGSPSVQAQSMLERSLQAFVQLLETANS